MKKLRSGDNEATQVHTANMKRAKILLQISHISDIILFTTVLYTPPKAPRRNVIGSKVRPRFSRIYSMSLKI